MRIYRHLTANDVRLESFPFKRELSMEAYLIDNEGVLALDEDVFGNVEIVSVELPLKEGHKRKNTDGRIDILATYSQEYVAIIELKLAELTVDNLLQLEDYLSERTQILEIYPDILITDSAPKPKWIGILIGGSIDLTLAEKLRQGYSTSEGIPIAALTIQRFRGSDGSVLVTTDSYFKQPASKDTTKYYFDGKKFGKGRLVLAVVKRYVEANPAITFAQLEKVFPKTCQGSAGVLATVDQANQIYSKTGRKRHFLNAEDLIQLQDVTAAVSSQWGTGNITRFLEQCRRLSYHVQAKVG